MALHLTKALKVIDDNITPVSTEIVPIELALGRILASDHVASFDLPRYDNSSRDGYAVKCADAGKSVTATSVLYAGDKAETALEAHSAIRIMTGAPIPKGCEAVVQFEDVKEAHHTIQLPEKITPGMYMRYAGEDMQRGTTYLRKGTKLSAYGITLLVSQGVTHVKVYRRLKVIVFSSGDELRSHYEQIEPHQLYNSNSPMFLARSQMLGCDVSAVEHIEDTLEALEEAINNALTADIIITTGGMNFGDKDFTQAAFTNCGMSLLFNRVELKPGKPVAFGKIANTAIFNLPGNPLGAMVAYEILVRTLIHKMSGNAACYHNTIETKLGVDCPEKRGFSAAILGKYDGQTFIPLPQQMAGMVSPLQDAEAMMITNTDTRMLKKGDRIKIIPIKWEFFSEKQEDIFTY